MATKYIITLIIPEKDKLGFISDKVNYWCEHITGRHGERFDVWDTDIRYAKIFTDKDEANITLKRLHNLVGSKKALLTPYINNNS